MSEIKYVCISDTHFGEEDSLLTNLQEGGIGVDPTRPNSVLESLVTCLRDIIERKNQDTKPVLILNGDILELALCSTNEAAMAFLRFIELAMQENQEIFSEIIYIPGNHDHHLWETARETQYVNHLQQRKEEPLDPPWHTTRLLAENQRKKVPSAFLTKLIQRIPHLRRQRRQVLVYYPNFGVKSSDGKRCVVFTHGHYIEPLYMLMSFLKGMIFPGQEPPATIDGIEAENFAWIDFFWSTMGRSGDVGHGVEAVYEKLQYGKGMGDIVSNLSGNLAAQFDIPLLWEGAEVGLVKALLRRTLERGKKRERFDLGSALGFRAEEGFRKYVTGPLLSQIRYEIDSILDEVTIVFGHTHKAFQKDMQKLEGFPRWVNVYNTGGWVVETTMPEPLHGGAVVLIDEDLQATSLCMYKEAENSGAYRVSVDEARHGGEQNNSFHQEVVSLVNPNADPWRKFSEVAAEAVRVRASLLQKRALSLGYMEKEGV
jgi:UDP-2,3-diacylglucosamine pyrophosphatase LpxH